MDRSKKIILNLPEYLLILSVMFYWYSAGLVINYIAILLIAVLVYQIISKNKILGLIISGLLICISLYLILALFSELSEFPSFNAKAKTLLFVGLAYFLSTITMSFVMFFKYMKIELNTKSEV